MTAVPAHAQQAPALAPAEVPVEGANDIVVTAQRREQRLQDVGIAISAVSSEQLANANIAVSQDIVRIVPSLKVATFSSAGTIFNIRGVSQNDYGDQQEPPVAVYQDDAYASSITLASFPVFDTARVEVLRGPQGTLFGRNATGGAIQFISNQPASVTEGYLRATVGSFGALNLEGAVSAPVSDRLAVRIAGQRSTGGNYLKATQPGAEDLGGQNNFALRGIAKWDVTPDVTARLTLRYLEADHERQAGLYSHQVSCPNAQFQGEFLPASETCAYFVGVPGVNPGPGTGAGGFRDDTINPARGGNPWRTAHTYPSYVNRKLFGSTLRLDADLGGVDLVSVTDYQHATKFYSEDLDGAPDPVGFYYAGMKLDQGSQEVRLSGSLGRNQWVVGAFGMIIDGDYVASYSQPVFSYFPAVDFRQRTESYAFFVQDEFAITSQLKLIGGVRYWHDRRIGSYNADEPNSGVDIAFSRAGLVYRQNGVVQPLTGVTISASDADRTFSGLIARAEIDYKPTPDLLLYLSYNRGTKSGGFTFSAGTPGPSAVANFFNNIPYEPETLNSYEAGLKATLGRGTTLNVAAFHYDYRNYQAFAQIGVLQSVLNLDARVNGIEADLSVEPVKGLTLFASGSYLDTRVKDVPIQDGSLQQRQLPQSPSFSGSATIRYAFALGSGTASLQADGQYSGAFCFTSLCSPDERERPYTVANLRVGYDFGQVEVAAFVNNVFERRYRIYAADNSAAGGFVDAIFAKPRTLGVSARVAFGNH